MTLSKPAAWSRRYGAILVAIGVTVALLVMILVSRRAPTPSPEESVTYRLKWLPNANYFAGYLAASAGFFADEHINVEIRPGGPDLDAARLVAAGTDDFGVTGADQLLLARQQGLDIVAIGALMQVSPVVFLALESSDITTPQDFEGRRIGIKPGTNTYTEFIALLGRAGIDRTALIEVPVRVDMARFYEGEVEVWPGYETNEMLQARSDGFEITALLAREFGVDTYGNVLITSAQTLRDRPGLVRRFVRSIQRAWTRAAEDPNTAVSALVAANPRLSLDRELESIAVVLELARAGLNAAEPWGWMSAERWELSARVLLDAGMLERAPEDLHEAFTVDFLSGGEAPGEQQR